MTRPCILEDVIEKYSTQSNIPKEQLKSRELKIRIVRYAKDYYPAVEEPAAEEDDKKELSEMNHYGHGIPKKIMYYYLLNEVKSLRVRGYNIKFYFSQCF
ncbi:hypothetical protein J4214_02930 [Candidatus Woesearchaeota archaeon]|nr:hypothetical protein [Candidatus Woesearchaeota archaeon]